MVKTIPGSCCSRHTDPAYKVFSSSGRAFMAFILLLIAVGVSMPAAAQELEPRAYRTMPIGLNFFVFAYGYSTGNVVADASSPIQDLQLDAHIPAVGYLRSFGLFGRSSSLSLKLPYYFMAGSAIVGGELLSGERSGTGDFQARLAMNLIGGPALAPAEFAKYKQGRNMGVSLSVSFPTGQYSGTNLINFGSNRWAFKPEVGYSSIRGPWILEASLGFWFFTTNTDFLGQTRTQEPIGNLQGHISYNFKSGIWLALDANYYTGGRSAIDGTDNVDLQHNSRVGLTLSLPLGGRHSLKFAGHTGAYTSLGTDFDIFQVMYQLRW